MFLAGSTLVAIRMDPTELLGHSWAAYGLFVFYLANGILILMLLRRRQQSTAAFRLMVHAGDIAWPAVISIFAEGPRTPFFLFFFFVLAAAAYRWGLWETLARLQPRQACCGSRVSSFCTSGHKVRCLCVH